MPAHLSFCCGLCDPCSSSEETDVPEEHDVDVEDAEIAEHRLRFLNYPYKCQITPRDLTIIKDEPRVSIAYCRNSFTREEWTAVFRSLVASNIVTDLQLNIQLNVPDEAPDFTILLQCPLKSLWVEISRDSVCAIPQTIWTVLEAQKGLKALTLFDANASDRLINLLNSECFPNLQYLFLCLDKDVDFGKLQHLAVLKVWFPSSITDEKIVDLRSLTRLRALDMYANHRAVLKLGAHRSLLKWLHLGDDVEVRGDVSTVTHLHLEGDAKYDIVGRCPNLKQLTLSRVTFNSPIAIPASVNRLLISGSRLEEVQLPAEQELDVVFLDNSRCPKLPQKFRARHLRVRNIFGNVPELREALRETDLGSPESFIVENINGGDVAVAFMESLLETEKFRRQIQFLATDLPLKKPLPPPAMKRRSSKK